MVSLDSPSTPPDTEGGAADMHIEQPTVSDFSFLGVPPLESRKEESIRDRRMDPRVACKGKIRFVQPSWARGFRGELLDVSKNGFRVSFAHSAPPAGAIVEFRHRFFRGRAQLMWKIRKDNHYEAGCRVLRD
jgi:hypothetical protein